MYDKDENGTIEQDEMVEVFKKIVKRKSKNPKINKHPLLSKRSPWKKSPKTKKRRATFISDHRVAFIFYSRPKAEPYCYDRVLD